MSFPGCLSPKAFGEHTFNPQHNEAFGKETRTSRNAVSARKMEPNATYIKQLSRPGDERN